MNRIVVDQASSTKFSGLADTAELCDEAGRVLGYFTPAQSPSLYEGLQVPFSEQELDQIEQGPKGRTLPEIMADLDRQA